MRMRTPRATPPWTTWEVDLRANRLCLHHPVSSPAKVYFLSAHGHCYFEGMASESVIETLRAFMAEREWGQFHTPENLAKSVAIEAGELLECFQWRTDGDRDDVADKLADVLTYALLLADELDLDPEQIVRDKLERTAEKYPVEKAKGRSTKYDRL